MRPRRPPQHRPERRLAIGSATPPNALPPGGVAGVMRVQWEHCRTEAARMDRIDCPAHAAVWRDIGAIIADVGPRVIALLEERDQDPQIIAERARAAADMPDNEPIPDETPEEAA